MNNYMSKNPHWVFSQNHTLHCLFTSLWWQKRIGQTISVSVLQ